jgi:hypothetical protein
VWPRPIAHDVLRAFREFTQGAPENASAYAGLATSPDGAPFVIVIAFHHGPTEEGEALFAPLRKFGPRVADMIQPTTLRRHPARRVRQQRRIGAP